MLARCRNYPGHLGIPAGHLLFSQTAQSVCLAPASSGLRLPLAGYSFLGRCCNACIDQFSGSRASCSPCVWVILIFSIYRGLHKSRSGVVGIASSRSITEIAGATTHSAIRSGKRRKSPSPKVAKSQQAESSAHKSVQTCIEALRGLKYLPKSSL